MPDSKMQGEVLWLRSFASKLIQRPLSSKSFNADYTSPDVLDETTKWDDQILNYKALGDHQKNTREYKLFVGTWNVGGISPKDDLNLEDWLDIQNNSCDIYVLGFQEVVPLNAKNVLGTENSRMHMKWNSLVRTTLNKSLSKQTAGQESKGVEKPKVYPLKERSSSDHPLRRGFECAISRQMVGILVSVWIRSDLKQFIRNRSVSCIGCGIMGCLGNKGAVSVRFLLHETSLCFVCCHLASGGKAGDERQRNSDAVEILSRTSFPSGACSIANLPEKILDHNQVIFFGDLNYRISLPESSTRNLVEHKQWNTLLEKDQLMLEMSKGQVFKGWNEGRISFSPTYKYYPNSDQYYGRIQGKKGEKVRVPAWCDRILWQGKGLRQEKYDRCSEARMSDHRPVKGIFSVEVDVPRSLNSLRSYFLSNRFDRLV